MIVIKLKSRFNFHSHFKNAKIVSKEFFGLTNFLLIEEVRRFGQYVLRLSSGGMFMSRFYLLRFINSGIHIGLRSSPIWLIHLKDKHERST